MKKNVLLLTLVFVLLLTPFTFASSEQPIKIVIDGVPQHMSPDPIVDEHGQIQVPAHIFHFAMQAAVDFDYMTQTIVINLSTKKMIFTVGSTEYDMNGQKIAMDTAPVLKDGVYYVPLGYVCEALGAKITRGQGGNTVNIDTSGLESFLLNDAMRKSNNTLPLLPAKKDGKYGFVNTAGEVVIDFVFTDATPFYKNVAFIANSSKKYGCINTKGQLVIPFKYDQIDLSSYNVAEYGVVKVTKNDLYGYVNGDGKEIVPCLNEEVSDFSGGVAFISREKWQEDWPRSEWGKHEWYSVDMNGNKLIVGHKYHFFGDYSTDGLARVSDANFKIGFVDRKGKLVIPYQYTRSYGFSFGIADVSKGGSKAGIDTKGRLITKFAYGDVQGLGNGFYAFKSGGKSGIAKNGKQIIKPDEYIFSYVSEGLIQATLFKKYTDGKSYKSGYFDTNGNLVIPFKFDNATSFFNGIAAVIKKESSGAAVGKVAFINKKGELLTDFIYDQYPTVTNYELNMQDGLIVVCKNNTQYGCVNSKGKEVLSCIYSDVKIYRGYIIAAKDGKYGCLDVNGNVLVPFIYDEIK